jgi:hypothetical protein
MQRLLVRNLAQNHKQVTRMKNGQQHTKKNLTQKKNWMVSDFTVAMTWSKDCKKKKRLNASSSATCSRQTGRFWVQIPPKLYSYCMYLSFWRRSRACGRVKWPWSSYSLRKNVTYFLFSRRYIEGPRAASQRYIEVYFILRTAYGDLPGPATDDGIMKYTLHRGTLNRVFTVADVLTAHRVSFTLPALSLARCWTWRAAWTADDDEDPRHDYCDKCLEGIKGASRPAPAEATRGPTRPGYDKVPRVVADVRIKIIHLRPGRLWL